MKGENLAVKLLVLEKMINFKENLWRMNALRYFFEMISYKVIKLSKENEFGHFYMLNLLPVIFNIHIF